MDSPVVGLTDNKSSLKSRAKSPLGVEPRPPTNWVPFVPLPTQVTVEVLDPTGAGDCFCATFVTLWSKGAFGFRDALERANAAGALAVTKVGPMEGNSNLAAIEALMRREA